MGIDLELLGGFAVRLDGADVAADGWRRRQAALLVKRLALAPGRRLHREQLIDALWPDLLLEDAAPRLHKAAHFARKATGRPDTIVVSGELIALFPDEDVRVDAVAFEAAASEALAEGSAEQASSVADLYSGDLLPEDLYESWTEDVRERLRLRQLDLLRLARRWEDLLELDPTDEEAHLGRIEELVAQGDRRGALRQYERMERALRRELGVGPSPEARALRASLDDASLVPEPARNASPSVLIGRDALLASLDDLLTEVGGSGSGSLFVSGPPGVGTTSLLEVLIERAEAAGWAIGTGSASSIEGAWPFAPVLEALAALCRGRAELLERLDERMRREIDDALAGAPLSLDGTTGHQRLFVAVAELLRLSAGDRPTLLVVDDVHDGDDASLRLLHYLARGAAGARVLIAMGHRAAPLPEPLVAVRDSLVSRGARDLRLDPLDRSGVASLLAAEGVAATDEVVEQAMALTGGVPFKVRDLARALGDGGSLDAGWRSGAVAGLGARARDALTRVALLGASFDTDEFLALSGLDVDDAYVQLDAALAALAIEPVADGYQFRHQIVRDALLGAVPPHRLRQLHLDAAEALERLGATPARLAHHLIAGGDRTGAVRHAIAAAEIEASMGAYRDALRLVESVRADARDADAATLGLLRADLLNATGDRGAREAYQEVLAFATGEDARRARAHLVLAAIMVSDLDLARSAARGLEVSGGAADAAVLMALGNVAYFSGELDRAESITDQARDLLLTGRRDWRLQDLVSLQGLIAHDRGSWSDRLRAELWATLDRPDLATTMFDSHLCVAECLLYGPTPYDDVIALAARLRDEARRSGALRAQAFATAVLGEAALLAGRLDDAAVELTEAVDLHREIGATAGEAHSMQRLAEVRLAEGDAAEAQRLLRQALPKARWSAIAMHLIQRIHGTAIRAAPDVAAARSAVERADASMDAGDRCLFCDVMYEVPAAIACARAGDLEDASSHLERAEGSAANWEGTAWEAAVLEARAELACAAGDPAQGAGLFTAAEEGFVEAGQPLDARRCRNAREVLCAVDLMPR